MLGNFEGFHKKITDFLRKYFEEVILKYYIIRIIRKQLKKKELNE